MKRATVLGIVALMLLIFINPSKMNIFSSSSAMYQDIKEIKSINTTKNLKYIKYKNKICMIYENKLKIIDENCNEVYEQELQSESIDLVSSNYIDILNKDTKKAFSIDENGKQKFSLSVTDNTFLYKSINENTYVSMSKNNDKEILKIWDSSGELNNKVDIEGNVTNIITIKDYILLSYISVTEKLETKIVLFDINGNLKKEAKFEDIALDILYDNQNIYVCFEDKIKILDENLVDKNTIDINGINSIKQDFQKNLFIKDSKNNLGYIKDYKYKVIKTNGENLSLEVLENTYVLYSNSCIYDNNLKQLLEFKEEIKDIQSIGKNTIAVFFNDNIKIYRMQ